MNMFRRGKLKKTPGEFSIFPGFIAQLLGEGSATLKC